MQSHQSNQRIEVRIIPEGAITIDAIGYTGSTGEEATACLEQALGTVGRRKRTPDRYRRKATRTTNANKTTNNTNRQQYQST